ncbi:MAG: alpha/beta fold hydrolase [Planctomycetota bacterium]|nr:alpha/beta fold hydrolase [Planctomycetota bacterium]
MRHTIVVMLAFGIWQTAHAQTDQETRTAVKSTTVNFETSDGVKIVADYYPPRIVGRKKAPVAILVHMYPADRTSWEPLVPRLIDAGFAVLAYDIRGTGDSVEPAAMKLPAKYKNRDKAHFNDAWRDAEAAKKWLGTQPGCDTSRVAMIGASIGCSISLSYGGRDDDVNAIVCLSPGTDYMGVDSIVDIKKCGKKAVLLLSPESEYDAVKSLVEASGGAAKSRKYPGTGKQHGTRMFAASYENDVKTRIVEFVRDSVQKEKGHGD